MFDLSCWQGEVLREEANGGWSYAHDEGGALRNLFGLLLHEQIFDETVTDAFFARCMGTVRMDLGTPPLTPHGTPASHLAV